MTTQELEQKTDEPVLLRLDLGGGKNPRLGFTNVDCIAFDGVDVVADLKQPWPWEDDSVDEIHTSHFIEHFSGLERVHIMNEAYRVMKVGAKMTIICPHWASCRAYGDPTHAWPPVSEFWFFYLDKNWRTVQAPHTDAEFWDQGFKCNFHQSFGYNLKGELAVKDDNYKQFACENYKEAIADFNATLTKVPL